MRTKKSMKTFYTIWAGQLVSTVGSGLTGFALGIWIYQETRSVTLYAVSMLAFMLPRLLFSPFAGVLADRYDRRMIMLLSDAGAGLSTIIVGLLFWNGSLEVWHVLLAEFTNATFNTFQGPAYASATTLLVPKERFGNASGMVQIAGAMSQLIAPALGGAIFVTSGLTTIVAIDFITFIFAVSTLIFVRFPQLERDDTVQKNKTSMWQEIREGWQYIQSRAGLVWLLVYFGLVNLFSGVIGPLITPMLMEQTTPDKLGYIASTIGIGMLVGTLLMSGWGGPKRRAIGIIAPMAIAGLLTMLLGIPSLRVLTVAGFFNMMLMPIANGSNRALWQIKVAPEIQGRVFSLTAVIGWSAPILATIIAGPLADRVFEPLLMEGGSLAGSVGRIIGTGAGRGTAFLFVIAGFMQFAISVLAWLHPRIRNIDYEIPDAIPDTLAGAPSVAAD